MLLLNYIKHSLRIRLGLVLAILLAVVLQGSLWHILLLLAGTTFLLVPFLLVLAGWASISLTRGQSLRPLKPVAIAWCACAACIGISYFVGWGLNEWKINAIRAYVAHAAPLLDQIKTDQGAFPAQLPISLLGAPPELLRDSGRYYSDGKDFYFYYSDPANIFGDGAQFDSYTRAWSYSCWEECPPPSK
jgi:hypothetical protein